MYFNVNFNAFFKLIKVHLLVSELCILEFVILIQIIVKKHICAFSWLSKILIIYHCKE